jgi:kumamolisin
VGGTSTNRNPFTGDFLYEGAWTLTGGGPSFFEPRPKYQNIIDHLAGPSRAVPDVALDSNPITGVWVLDTNLYAGQPGGWFIVGGTSVAVQAMGGIINAASHFHNSSAEELRHMYEHIFDFDAFNDITRDNCGPYGGFLAAPGYDFCTGLGSDHGYEGK